MPPSAPSPTSTSTTPRAPGARRDRRRTSSPRPSRASWTPPILWGVNAPPGFPVGGIAAAAGAAQTGANALEAIDKALGVIETDGLVPNGIASSAAIGGALRAAYRSVAALPGEAPTQQVYGVPVAVTSPWDSTKGDAIVGDWSQLVIGVREDINFELSNEGVLADPAGDIQVSAFQDDMTLIRVVFRAGCVLATPLQADGTGRRRRSRWRTGPPNSSFGPET